MEIENYKFVCILYVNLHKYRNNKYILNKI